jgi:mRNA-degrading endonuclease toxin of MazEF toxin-antitoxin module
LTGPETPPLRLQRRVVIEVGDPCLADGLLQWPETRSLIEARLGPQVLAVAEERVRELAEKLQALGLSFRDQAPALPHE